MEAKTKAMAALQQQLVDQESAAKKEMEALHNKLGAMEQVHVTAKVGVYFYVRLYHHPSHPCIASHGAHSRMVILAFNRRCHPCHPICLAMEVSYS